MKRLTLVKTCGSSALGHLYEHLFYDALVQFLTSKKLVSRLDYFIHARTYEPGLVHVDIELYTSAAQELAGQLAKQRISVDDASVAIALMQVMAENEVAFQGDKGIFKALKDIDGVPWRDLKDIYSVDVRAQVDSDVQIKKNDNIHLETQTLKLTLAMPSKLHLELTPLFAVVAQIILANLENSLMDTYGYYAFDERTQLTPSKVSLSSLLRASKQHRKTLTGELATCQETATWLLGIEFVKRLHAYLESLNGTHEIAIPDELDIYNATRVLVGRRGWGELGSEHNIKTVLQSTALELQYGKEKGMFTITELLR